MPPRNKHHCPNCRYLGTRRATDFYFCICHYDWPLGSPHTGGAVVWRRPRARCATAAHRGIWYRLGINDHRRFYSYLAHGLRLAARQGFVGKDEADAAFGREEE